MSISSAFVVIFGIRRRFVLDIVPDMKACASLYANMANMLIPIHAKEAADGLYALQESLLPKDSTDALLCIGITEHDIQLIKYGPISPQLFYLYCGG